MKEKWVQLKDLIGLDGLPKTIQGMTYKAKAEKWNRRRVLGIKGRVYEYELPTVIQKKNFEAIDKPYDNDCVTIKFDSKRYVLVPEFNVRVAAGCGFCPDDEEQIGQFVFSRYWLEKEGLSNAKLGIFHVVGDSMETTINDGDIVLINIKEEGWNGALSGVFIILVNDLLMVKRIQYDMLKNGFHIKSDNPIYDPYFIKPDDGITFKVVAKVERVLTKMRPTKHL